MIEYYPAKSETYLRQIIALQQLNLPTTISKEELDREGFVTVKHELSVLEAMKEEYPHIVALDGDRVVGYALVMLQNYGQHIPVLVPMFAVLDQIEYQGRPLRECRYFVMGQVCIDKPYRGEGIFAGLFEAMAREMSPDFSYIVTQIARRNPRSVRAHEKVGFEVIHTYIDPQNGEDWLVVLLDITARSS